MPLLAPPAKLLRMGWRPVHTHFSPTDTSKKLPEDSLSICTGVSAPRSSVGRSRDGNLIKRLGARHYARQQIFTLNQPHQRPFQGVRGAMSLLFMTAVMRHGCVRS